MQWRDHTTLPSRGAKFYNSLSDEQKARFNSVRLASRPAESPYVAAFFAFSGLEGCVAVWVIDSESHVWNEENGCTLVKVPALWNQRIRNQFGRFTYLRAPYDTLEEYVNQFEAGEASLQKYLIHIRDFRLAMSELDAMGLTHARIYPGLEGNARAAEIRVALRRAS